MDVDIFSECYPRDVSLPKSKNKRKKNQNNIILNTTQLEIYKNVHPSLWLMFFFTMCILCTNVDEFCLFF